MYMNNDNDIDDILDDRFIMIINTIQNTISNDFLSLSEFDQVKRFYLKLNILKNDIQHNKHLSYKIPHLSKRYKKNRKITRGGEKTNENVNMTKLFIRIGLCIIIAIFGTLYLDETFSGEIDFFHKVSDEIVLVRDTLDIPVTFIERIFDYLSKNDKLKIILQAILFQIKKQDQCQQLMELLFKCDLIKIANAGAFILGFYEKFNSFVDFIYLQLITITDTSIDENIYSLDKRKLSSKRRRSFTTLKKKLTLNSKSIIRRKTSNLLSPALTFTSP